MTMDHTTATQANFAWKSSLSQHPAFIGQGMQWHCARHYPLGDLRILSRHEDGSYWWKGLPVYQSKEVASMLDPTFTSLP